MTRYSRSVIPGRQASENDMDRMVFGDGQSPGDAANDAEGEAEDDIPVVPKRRRGRRTNDDFRPLPGERGMHDTPENKRAPLVLLGVLLTIGVFGFVVWNAYSKGTRAADAAATPELAEAGPFKVRAAPAETKATTPETATVFERVESKPATPAPKSIAPTPDTREQPVAPVAVAAATPPPAAPVTKPAAASPPPAAAATKPVTPAPAPAPAAAKPATPPVIAAPPPVVTATASPPPLAAPKPAAAAPAVVAAPVEPKLAGAYKPVFSAGGSYLVQVAAAPSEADAQAEWDKRAKAAPDLYSAAEKIIVRADVNGRTVYRIRAGSFATAGDATAFCEAIKARRGDCFRTTR